MFNTYHTHRTAAPYPQHVESHEHRAPTDESVRLLREMEQKAIDSVIHAIRCDANQFKFRATVMENHRAFNKIARIQFSLNEQAIDFEVEFPRKISSIEETASALKKAITEKLAEVLVINLAEDHFLKL